MAKDHASIAIMSEKAPDLEYPSKILTHVPHQRWLWKILLLVALIAGMIAFAWFYDEPPPDDSDLVVIFPVYPENDPDNGFPLLVEAGKLADTWPSANLAFNDKILEAIFETPESMDMDKAKALIVLNEPALAAYQQVWAKPKFYNPKPLDIDPDPRWRSALVSYTNLECLRANILLRERKFDEALATLDQLADDLSKSCEPEGRELVVSFLTHLSVIGRLQQTLLGSCRYLETKDQCLRAIKILCKLEENLSANRFKMSLRTEYMFFRQKAGNGGAKLLEELQEMKKHKWIKEAPSRLSFKPNKLLHEYAEITRELLPQYLDDTYMPYSAPPPEPSLLPSFIREWPIWKWLGLGEKAGQNFLIELMGVNSGTLWKITVNNKAQTRMTQTALALRAYWLEHDHRLPMNLEELVPEYLSKIPIDPFGNNKAPIRYDTSRRLLWSIGSDGIDRGGDESDDGQYSNIEPTFKLPWE